MTRRKPIGQRLAEEYEAYQRYLLPEAAAASEKARTCTCGAQGAVSADNPGGHRWDCPAREYDPSRYVTIDVGDLRWVVETTYDGTHDVGAARLEVSGGALVFYDRERRVLVAYGSGFWKAVSR